MRWLMSDDWIVDMHGRRSGEWTAIAAANGDIYMCIYKFKYNSTIKYHETKAKPSFWLGYKLNEQKKKTIQIMKCL